MSFVLSERAARDLDDIFFHGLMNFGLQQAERHRDGLSETLSFLAEHPQAARLRTEIQPATRAYPYGVHLIVYDIEPNGNVAIVRVRHGRENWQADPRGQSD